MKNNISSSTTGSVFRSGVRPALRSHFCRLAVAIGVAAGSSVCAYDYVTYSVSIPTTTVTDWSLSHILPKLTPADNPNGYELDPVFGIQIIWSATEISRFRFDNDDAVGASVDISFTAQLTLTVPGVPVATTTVNLAESSTIAVTADDGDGVFPTPGQYLPTDGFDTTLTKTDGGVYLVPFANHVNFIGPNGSTVSIPVTAIADSSIDTGAVGQSIRNNTAGSTVTIVYALVPESNPLTAIVPGLAILAGLVTWRQRRAK